MNHERRPIERHKCLANFVDLIRIKVAGFQLVDGDPYYHDGSAFQKAGLCVLVSASYERDGHLWLHLSASRKGRVPTYEDLCTVKHVFAGKDRLALQLFVPEAEHVNINPWVLHLWCPLEHRPVPDFRHSDAGVLGI